MLKLFLLVKNQITSNHISDLGFSLRVTGKKVKSKKHIYFCRRIEVRQGLVIYQPFVPCQTLYIAEGLRFYVHYRDTLDFMFCGAGCNRARLGLVHRAISLLRIKYPYP